MPRAVINGESVECHDNASVLEALLAAGIHLPALCHDDRLAPSGACRLCLVDVQGIDRPAPACTTRVADGMVNASGMGIGDGELVRLVSRYGAAVLPIHYSPAMVPGQLFATFHTVEAFLNAVTGPYRDAVVGTPAYKVTAVRIERAVEVGVDRVV
jgi:predicted molibdopterin-dependent oxidoreductase YjgC